LQQKGEVVLDGSSKQGNEEDAQGKNLTTTAHRGRSRDDEFHIQNDEDPTREDLDEEEGLVLKTT